MTGSNKPRLLIKKQNALAIEKFSENGIHKDVHIVVKNNPFLIQIGLVSSAVPLSNLKIVAKLLYDTPETKEVDFVKNKPMEYKTNISREGDKATLEFRLKVLTRQLEDMFFLIRIDILTDNNRLLCSQLTNPIKVISKPDQLNKRPTRRARKRPLTDDIKDTLVRIEETQKLQAELIKKLYDRREERPVHHSIFEQSFAETVKRFQEMPSEERPTKLRKVISYLSLSDLVSVNELTEQLLMNVQPIDGVVGVDEVFPANAVCAAMAAT